ncbi:hypothetical protein [Mycobacterium sp. Marseille-P9652]|uniref:hypothetical protein n=1 Tax=Mycobacterium sp. Marseille-P9652 TaxID=2654950 RepID=UPI0012E8016E|nr:hypothetical protein [Mycobacterium sp. Marseille-P9652]
MNGAKTTRGTLTGTVAGALVSSVVAVTASGPAAGAPHADALPASGQVYPLRPSPALAGDARSEIQDLLAQISDLDNNWESLTQAQRQQRFTQLQQQAAIAQQDSQNVPPGQQPEVLGMLGLAIARLLDVGRKVRQGN